MGPAAKPPITAPVMKPAGSCGEGFCGAVSASATALTPISPRVHITFDCAIFMTLLLCCGHSRRPLPPREEHLAPGFGRSRYRAMAKYGNAEIKPGACADYFPAQ
jgi:hypothetical protein